MTDLKLNQEKLSNGVCYLEVVGVIDTDTSLSVHSQLSEIVNGGCYRLIINLSQVEYISSAGVGVFVGIIGICQKNDGNLVLVHPSAADEEASAVGLRPGFNVLEVFSLLGLTELFSFVPTREKAEAFFN